MAIRHILKDGRVVKDLGGHVVKIEDAVSAYALMDAINQGRRYEKENKK